MRLHKTANRVVTQIVHNTEHYMVNQNKDNETVMACSNNGVDKKIHTKFLSTNMNSRDPLKGLSIEKKIL
jgi:hypothetical protein